MLGRLATRHSRISAPKVGRLVPTVDQPDLTVASDDRSGGGSRIVPQDRANEEQELHASVASTSGVMIGGTERRNNRTSTCDPFDWDQYSCGSHPSPRQIGTPTTLEGE